MRKTGDAASGPTRRKLIKGLGIAASGLALGGGIGAAAPREDGEAPAMAVPDARPWSPSHGHVDVTWSVDTAQKLVALTFDDGPMPKWTPMVHDILDAERVKATFFMVGERVVRNARLVHGRMDRHEAGNHTWTHVDLAVLSHEDVCRQVRRAHNAIATITGKEPRHLRPPFGRLGGATLSAAGQFGYDLTIWSIKMLEKTYQHDPPQLVDYIVNNTRPGSIVLAHDTGNEDRLVALRNLVPMIRGLRAKGFEFVTVSELMTAAGPPPAAVRARGT
ncbi:peptidoglycan/xylan/chitin deacetylase (PgdA/CDA1 family) [Actinomadura pelletieri DSM 43383]|uniref:Peptidoglycan/xylan/chitin deacetylase (PgdA/CDA1 family) n=1 Tax=Actinomadura pelletieri DSM 43383 TaxID=1120940 RepID=A0A495Q9N3_9ACTN|nr:polysaccharide deacetylase family protein [Actinomadura pelletieri]RKS67806.1 peptidoglycan/xylan/chitin deacetylase (PgdA/CDA1 family) [Actinomadura pelletieri DSM 43383]